MLFSRVFSDYVDGNSGAPEQLFYSGLSIEDDLIPECEIIYEEEDLDGLDSKFDWCEKNPKHANFIRICDFSKDHLPEHLRTDETMAFIKTKIDLTVRIRIPYTTLDRPDFVWGQENERNPYPYMHHKGNKKFTRNGTGCVMSVSEKISEDCPCHPCRTSGERKKEYFLFTVRTVAHNLFNDEEAALAVVNCFFNNENDEEKEGVIHHLYGLRLDDSDGKKDRMYETDTCDLICASHDESTAEKFSKLLSDAKSLPGIPCSKPFTEVVISHPHGCTKRISVGAISHLAIPIKPDFKIDTPYPLPSGTTRCFVKSTTSSSSNENEKTEIEFPPGTTFALSKTAVYAMKFPLDNVDSNDDDDERPTNVHLFSFPRGTKFEPPIGTIFSGASTIPDGAEFEFESGQGSWFSLEKSYTCNIVGGCAGTSGAMVYSNLMEDEVLTDLRHTSKFRPGKVSMGKTQPTE